MCLIKQTETKLSDEGPIVIGNAKFRVDHALQMELVPLSVLEAGLKLVPECFISIVPTHMHMLCISKTQEFDFNNFQCKRQKKSGLRHFKVDLC